jgi:hypothetical protein
MAEPINYSQEKEIITAVFWIWTIGFVITCVLPVFLQIFTWLKTGIYPEKDLYWLFADVSCAATDFRSAGFNGKDLCRLDYIEFTDWVGANKIINWMFDLHVGVVFLALSLYLALSILCGILQEARGGG